MRSGIASISALVEESVKVSWGMSGIPLSQQAYADCRRRHMWVKRKKTHHDDTCVNYLEFLVFKGTLGFIEEFETSFLLFGHFIVKWSKDLTY